MPMALSHNSAQYGKWGGSGSRRPLSFSRLSASSATSSKTRSGSATRVKGKESGPNRTRSVMVGKRR